MNILHLSDIHFGRNDPAYGLSDPFAKHDRILDELIETVSKLEPELRPEHIVFTGDIAWHGKRTEFAEAYEWFKKLLDALGLEGKDISFCVGNHDVDWGYRCIDEDLSDSSYEKIGNLYRYENVHLMEPSIYAYDEFCHKLGMLPYAYPVGGKKEYSYSVGYKDVPFACGKTVRLVSLNTSLLITQPGISNDKMWLGQEQLKSLIEYGILPSEESVWYTIMLYHHSDRFLHPNETSTYDGRCATLPMMMSYADLLLCGHTESSGRPRLTKQLGGGMLLSAGAAYYNDEHHNAFSMLYLSDERRIAGFLPYVYDGGWKDYDFEQPEIDAKKRYELSDSGEIIYGAKLLLQAGEKVYEIPADALHVEHKADGGVYIDNSVDPMNYFALSASCKTGENTKLSVCLAEVWHDFLRARFAWKKYTDFMTAAGCAGKTEWKIVAKDGMELLSGANLSAFEEIPFDEVLMQKLRLIEFYFDIRFTLPREITENDRSKISMLTELSENEFTDRAATAKTVSESVGREKLQELIAHTEKDDTVYLRNQLPCVVELFGVSISFGTVSAIAGPYRMDREEVRQKLSTFCEGDLRTLTYQAADDAKAYLVRNMDEFAEKHGEVLKDGTVEVETLPLTLTI